MTAPTKNSIVAGGRGREEREHMDRVQAEVRARYAAQLAGAGWLGRLRIRWKIRREIRRELEKLAPRGGLYSNSQSQKRL